MERPALEQKTASVEWQCPYCPIKVKGTSAGHLNSHIKVCYFSYDDLLCFSLSVSHFPSFPSYAFRKNIQLKQPSWRKLKRKRRKGSGQSPLSGQAPLRRQPPLRPRSLPRIPRTRRYLRKQGSLSLSNGRRNVQTREAPADPAPAAHWTLQRVTTSLSTPSTIKKSPSSGPFLSCTSAANLPAVFIGPVLVTGWPTPPSFALYRRSSVSASRKPTNSTWGRWPVRKSHSTPPI